ncbi:YbbR-like domain-containing protein [uncultured Winogradskyella sp.]|jgi:YbbR domain-containing protein|uniref:YbbR-like domain-containing protein n=1 Tax=uncultured Winogradskyella sp. TaxID=395353 RepID=UPI0025DD0A79|nr:YbbR-like domain-containing protein [uncultured Winogradskyella sp.]
MRKPVSKYILKIFKRRNVKRFSFFLGAAFLFLMLTKLSETNTQSIDLDIKLYNLEDEIVVLEDSLSSPQVTLRAKGFSLLKYMFKTSKTIRVDAQNETSKRGKQLLWDIGNNKYQISQIFGNSIEILDIKPDTVYFAFDVLSSKKVPVQLIKDVSYASGFDVINELKLSKDSVKIIGSKRHLDTVMVIKTNKVTLDNVNSDISEQVTFINLSRDIEILPKSLELNGVVKRFTEGKFSLPVHLINAPIGKKVNFFPKNIDLIYYVDVERFKKVKPEDFTVVCDFSRLNNATQNNLELQIVKSSSFVKSSRLAQNRVEFIISD